MTTVEVYEVDAVAVSRLRCEHGVLAIGLTLALARRPPAALPAHSLARPLEQEGAPHVRFSLPDGLAWCMARDILERLDKADQ